MSPQRDVLLKFVGLQRLRISMMHNLLDGGASFEVTMKNSTLPEVIYIIHPRNTLFTCSYEEGKRILEESERLLQTGVQ